MILEEYLEIKKTDSHVVFYNSIKKLNINHRDLFIDTAEVTAIESFKTNTENIETKLTGTQTFLSTLKDAATQLGKKAGMIEDIKIKVDKSFHVLNTGYEKIDPRLTPKYLEGFKVVNARKFSRFFPFMKSGGYHELIEICFVRDNLELLMMVDLQRNTFDMLFSRFVLLNVREFKHKNEACPKIDVIKANRKKKYNYFTYNNFKNDLPDEFGEWNPESKEEKPKLLYISEDEVTAVRNITFLDIFQATKSFYTFRFSYNYLYFNCQHYATAIFNYINNKLDNGNDVSYTDITSFGQIYEFDDGKKKKLK